MFGSEDELLAEIERLKDLVCKQHRILQEYKRIEWYVPHVPGMTDEEVDEAIKGGEILAKQQELPGIGE